MPNSNRLSSLFRAAIKPKTSASAQHSSSSSSSLQTPPTTSHSFPNPSTISPTTQLSSKNNPPPTSFLCDSILTLLAHDDSAHNSEDARERSKDITDVLMECDSVISADSVETDGRKFTENPLNIPWLSNMSSKSPSLRRKEITRERKGKWIFKSSRVNRIERVVKLCGQKLGTEATIEIFGKLGCETGVKEYNSLIKLCIGKAKTSNDEVVALEQISLALQLLKSMKERGFPIEEETYGPSLMYFIELGMVDEFRLFCNVIKDCNPSSVARLGYYEMLLYIGFNDQEKIEEICNYISIDHNNDTANLRENYLLALCETDRKDELVQLLDVIDITKFSSVDHVASLFKSLGRLLLESFAEKFLLQFKEFDYGVENISNLIFDYTTSVPNLAVEDVVSKFKSLHSVLEMAPSSESYEKLVIYSCNLLKVHVALDILQLMCAAGFTLSLDTLHSLLRATEESFEFNLVGRIYSLICNRHMEPTTEIFKSMISLSVKMKDFDGAYAMLNDLKKFNLKPTASMYNAIMAGCYREKNIYGALMVLKQMKLEDVKPDVQTYCYLINNCDSEEQIIKFYEEMDRAGIKASKHVYMALINAYATCGQFEKAKEVLLDNGIPYANFNEIKSVLVSALASHGRISDALEAYDEIKEAGCNLEPKAVISLIEYFQSEGELSKLLELLEELHDPDFWVDGCGRVILYCVRNKHLRYAVNLLKQLKHRCRDYELGLEVLLNEIFLIVAEAEPSELQMGMDMLKIIKNELQISPSRKCLDFLLHACIKAKDLHNATLIWKEYQAAGLPYNVISYLRMYQALLACGDHESAKTMLTKFPKDDLHVCILVQECQRTYKLASPKKGKKKKH